MNVKSGTGRQKFFNIEMSIGNVKSVYLIFKIETSKVLHFSNSNSGRRGEDLTTTVCNSQMSYLHVPIVG